MALIKPSPLVAAIRGSIAGTTFRHAGHSDTTQRRPSSSRHHSATLPQRRAISNLMFAWRTITAAQRATWQRWFNIIKHAHIPFGQGDKIRSRPLSAMSLFMSYNLPRQLYLNSYVATAPTNFTPYQPVGAVASFINPTTLQFAFNLWTVPPTTYLVALLSQPFSPAVKHPRTWTERWRLFTGPLSAPTNWTLSPPLFSGSQVQVTSTRIYPNQPYSLPSRQLLLWP
jgi:hypothetical protein